MGRKVAGFLVSTRTVAILTECVDELEKSPEVKAGRDGGLKETRNEESKE